MNRKLLSIIAAIGLTLGSAAQAMQQGLGAVATIKPVGLGIISFLAPEIKQEEKQKNIALQAEAQVAACETGGYIVDHKPSGYAILVNSDQAEDGVAGITTYLVKKNLGSISASKGEKIAFRPFVKRQKNEDLTHYLGRVEKQKQYYSTVYTNKLDDIEDPCSLIPEKDVKTSTVAAMINKKAPVFGQFVTPQNETAIANFLTGLTREEVQYISVQDAKDFACRFNALATLQSEISAAWRSQK